MLNCICTVTYRYIYLFIYFNFLICGCYLIWSCFYEIQLTRSAKPFCPLNTLCVTDIVHISICLHILLHSLLCRTLCFYPLCHRSTILTLKCPFRCFGLFKWPASSFIALNMYVNMGQYLIRNNIFYEILTEFSCRCLTSSFFILFLRCYCATSSSFPRLISALRV